MSTAAWLAFLAAAAVGAPARYLVDSFVQTRTATVYPWGTLTVNAVGSLVLGVLTGFGLHHGLGPTSRTVLGTGFCGAFTTFSTFTFETVRLAEAGEVGLAVRNLVANTAIAGLLAGLGLAVTLL